MTKHDILQKTGITSETFDRATRRFFGEVVDSVPEIWMVQFIKTITNKLIYPSPHYLWQTLQTYSRKPF